MTDLGALGRARDDVGVFAELDLEASRLSIRRSLVMVGEEVADGVPKTTIWTRTIDLDEPVVVALRKHRLWQMQEKLGHDVRPWCSR